MTTIKDLAFLENELEHIVPFGNEDKVRFQLSELQLEKLDWRRKDYLEKKGTSYFWEKVKYS